jgi:hypothetical protein
MHITTHTELTDILWDGLLEPPVVMRSDTALAASIGRPAQWADGQLLGDKWQPPVGGGRYYLLRLAFSLRPGERSRASISAADFCLRLHPQAGQQAIVFDAYPREQLVEQERPVTLGIGPALKLGAVDGEAAKAETTIDFGRVLPVIHSDGLGEAAFCWRYSAHRRQPLLGSRAMYAVIHLPAGIARSLATLELAVTAEDRLGPIRLSPPTRDASKLRWVVGEA